MAVEPRVTKSVRLSAAGVEAVETIMERYGVDFSEALRRMLKIAYPKMPDAWPEERRF